MLASRQPAVASVRRDAWVEVDLDAIEHNLGVVRSAVNKKTKVMAVVKSDAYGHGAPSVAEVLAASGAHSLGVASIDEGCQLRAAGITAPILLLSPCPGWACSTALDADLQLTVTSPSQIADIARATKKMSRPAKVHVKVDTGMHRLGIRADKAVDLISRLMQSEGIKLCGLFSHLACADDQEFTAVQNREFQRVLLAVKQAGYNPGIVHLASSDAIRRFPDTQYDMVRPGLMLYGLEPRAVSEQLKPAMSVRARINHLSQLEAGESVGYNLIWTASRQSAVASIPVGYADGIDRGLSNRMSGLLHGKLVSQVGLISMDQMLFDITDVPQAAEGDVITLLGNDGQSWLHMADWAQKLNTITYELACRLRARMPRVYTRHRADAKRVGDK